MRWAVEGDTLPADVLRQAQAAGLLWVAEADGQPGGFALAEPMDGSLFLLEMSVALPQQGRGLGSALLAAVIAHARDCGYASLLLTTDRELSWNGPYYRRRGFSELGPGAMVRACGPGWTKRPRRASIPRGGWRWRMTCGHERRGPVSYRFDGNKFRPRPAVGRGFGIVVSRRVAGGAARHEAMRGRWRRGLPGSACGIGG